MTLGHSGVILMHLLDTYKASAPPQQVILLNCIKKISAELSDEPGLARVCHYLALLVEGLSCKAISRQLGLSREHVSRVYRKKAIELVIEHFFL